MMRSVILLLLATQCAAQMSQEVQCSINAAQAIDEMLDSIVFIWASVQRCSGMGRNPGDTITCEIDVASSAQSVNGMINVMVGAMKDCGNLKTDECGVAAGYLTQSTSGLAASAGGVIKECHAKPRDWGDKGRYQIALCVVNAKDATRSLLRAITHIIAAKQDCESEDGLCAADSMHIISAFAAMSQYVSGAIGRCHKGQIGGMNDINVACAEQSSSFVRFASDFASAAAKMSVVCKEGAARLYEIRAKDAKVKSSTVSSMSLMLFALLPITGLMAFQGGRRFGKFQAGQPQDELGVRELSLDTPRGLD